MTFTSLHIVLAKCSFRFSRLSMENLNFLANSFQLGLLRMYAWDRSGGLFPGKKDRNISFPKDRT